MAKRKVRIGKRSRSAEATRKRRQRMTEEQKAKYRAAAAERQRIRRQMMTEEEKAKFRAAARAESMRKTQARKANKEKIAKANKQVNYFKQEGGTVSFSNTEFFIMMQEKTESLNKMQIKAEVSSQEIHSLDKMQDMTVVSSVKIESSNEMQSEAEMSSEKIEPLDMMQDEAVVSSEKIESLQDKTELLSEKIESLDEIKEKGESEKTEILEKIREIYVPFLKKFISFLEKHQKTTPENITKLKTIFKIFTTASSEEQVETFTANEEKLEHWYKKVQKDKRESGSKKRKKIQEEQSMQTDQSEDGNETSEPSAKKEKTVCTVSNTASSESSSNANQNSSTSNKVLVILAPVASQEKPKEAPPAVTKTSELDIRNISAEPQAVVSPNKEITFTCSSCQFQTQDEEQYMTHARENHKTDLSLWCKDCAKCFSNAGVLVSHIKDGRCFKEDMIFKCAAKECNFESNIGQTFVHHLRHCHKGSPFIFCIHCQKIFTLPHCLVLHMQDDCEFKERNRVNPSGASTGNAKPAAITKQPTLMPRPSPGYVRAAPGYVRPASGYVRAAPGYGRPNLVSALNQPRKVHPAVAGGAVRPMVQSPAMRPYGNSVLHTPRGRRPGRGRGRGRRKRFSDSSDSDDPDDPLWLIEESVQGTTPRRSARWAKKLNDVMNPEFTVGDANLKSFNSAELNKEMINCPCCDFMAAFQSVLEDHYIASHKVPNKNACLVCHLKFEETRFFLNHFEEHRKGLLPSQPFSEPEKPKEVSKEVEPVAKINSAPVVTLQNSVLINTSSRSEPKELLFSNVIVSITEGNFPKSLPENVAKIIPYQAAMHDKNTNSPQILNFEAFKSKDDLIAMKTVERLKHFFRCGCFNCTFTTDDKKDFILHLKEKHNARSYICCYCLKEESSDFSIVEHIVSSHSKLIYQCSLCFYRACSKAHVKIHYQNHHCVDSSTDILICKEQNLPSKNSESPESLNKDLNAIWPYVCAIGQCDFSTYDPKEFKFHSENVHSNVVVYQCHYCKAGFQFKQLMNHYRLHGLNLFQCCYCLYGTETKEEILVHICNVHAGHNLKAYMRGSKDEVLSEIRELKSVMKEDSTGLIPENVSSGRNENLSNCAKEKVDSFDCEMEFYDIMDKESCPEHLKSVYFPKYLKKLLSDVVCGVPFCNVKFKDVYLYITHLVNEHKALNMPCPHCPEMCNSLDAFKSHLLCHGSKLYACGEKDCVHYDWNRDKVMEHKKTHHNSDLPVIAVRELASTTDEDDLHDFRNFELKAEVLNAENGFSCAFCKYKSENQNIMKNHMYREMAYLRFSCSLCGMKYFSRKGIKNHFIFSHPESDILCSNDCNCDVETIVSLKLKQELPEEETKSCVLCGKKFHNFLQLQFHLCICLQKKYHPYKCNHCKKFFVNLLALKYHTDKEHCSKVMDYTFTPNYAIEDDVSRKLLDIRLKCLKDLTKELEVGSEEKLCKIYACGNCEFKAFHKFNFERHNKEVHSGTASVTKTSESSSSKNLNSQNDENSEENITSSLVAKAYTCGSCVKKMLTIQEVEMHMRKSHGKIVEYFYYYSPDADKQFSESDKETFACAYCKSSQDNLFSLKKHHGIMHHTMEFKVKGYLCTQPKSNYLACGYCYLKLDSESELQDHLSIFHASLPLKSFGNVQMAKGKRTHPPTNEFSNKRVKFGSSVYVCAHCNGAFSSLEHITIHSKKSHSRLKLEFTKLDLTSENVDFKFFKCEFCKFTAERQFLDRHLELKHKMRVTCSYCARRFEFASKLKEHHEAYHKNLPIKYIQETVNVNKTLNSDLNHNKSDITDKEVVYNITIPKTFLKHSNNVNDPNMNSLAQQTEESEFINLPLSYVIEHFNVSPKVVLKDIKNSISEEPVKEIKNTKAEEPVKDINTNAEEPVKDSVTIPEEIV